jgi:rsbT antagonist protein RsbS
MAEDRISVIKVRDTLMVTMPPDPDDATISLLQEKTLTAMEKHESTSLVLDISAVETFDSFFARTVSETAKMVALMGGRTIIAGMRPAVAITATQLGLQLGTLETALNVDRALDMTSSGREQPRVNSNGTGAMFSFTEDKR